MDKNKKNRDEMVEYWQPPEERTWQAAPKEPRPLKIPKVKEPKDAKDGKKNGIDTCTNTSGFFYQVKTMILSIKTSIDEMVSKGKAYQAKVRANKVAPIHTKVQARHLELEPLCCLSSCLVRGGCSTVVAFEAFYFVATTICILTGMSRGGFTLWEPLPNTFNAYFGHHLFYYAVGAYDAALLIMLLILLRGLVNFDKSLVNLHYYFCFVSLGVNLVFLLFSIWTLSSPGAFSWSFSNCFLVLCFVMQVPLQIWAISVVKSCRDFFALIQVFVTLAEA